MSDFVISENKIKTILILMNRDTVMDEDDFLEIAKDLRSRPLSEELKRERERVLGELVKWIDEQVPKKDLEHPFYECKTRTKKYIESAYKHGFNDGQAEGLPEVPNLHKCVHKEIRNGVEFCHYHDSPTDPTAIRKAEREKVLELIHKKTYLMKHQASSCEVNSDTVVIDYSAVYELLRSMWSKP